MSDKNLEEINTFSDERNQNSEQERIQWHPAFCSAIRLELKENKMDLEYENEHNLGKKPLQIDLLVIKKSDDVVVQNDIGKIFSRSNIMEFKSPRDGLNINDYFKVLGYACLYKAEEEHMDDIRNDDVTISLVRDTRPVKLMKAFERQGLQIRAYRAGIYYIENSWFPMQMIITSELDQTTHLWLRALTEKLSSDEAELLLRETSAHKETDEEALIDSVMTVSMSANKESFGNVKEEPEMYQFVKILAGDEIKAASEEARRKGREEGREEGSKAANIRAARRMLKRGVLSYVEIAEDFDLSIEQVEQLAEELESDMQFT